MIRRALVLAAVFTAALGAQRTPPRLSTDERLRATEAHLQKDPKNTAVRNEMVGQYLQKLRESGERTYLDRASRVVDDLLKSEPLNYDARRHRLEIELQRHHFREAVILAKQLTLERPEDPIVWGLLGDALMELGDYDSAEPAYQKMADLRPSMASYSRAAFFRIVTGDASGAIALMRQAIRMGAPSSENVAWCLADLGNMLFKTGAVDEAERAFLDALAAYPGYHPASAGMGRVLAVRGRYREALDAFRNAQARVPLPEYAASLAKLYRQIGDEASAQRQIALLDLADTLDKAAGETANRSLAMAFADLNYKTSRALELATAELQVRGDVYTYDALAWARFRNGNYQDAAAAMRKALSLNTPEPMFHEHATLIYEALGLTGEARRGALH